MLVGEGETIMVAVRLAPVPVDLDAMESLSGWRTRDDGIRWVEAISLT